MAVSAVAFTALLGGTAGYLTLDRTVTISVDGQSHKVSGFARTVGAVLNDEGIKTGPHDTVSPAANTKIEDGQTIAVRHGRQVVLTVDGAQRASWTTAETVDEALLGLGLHTEGAYLSASRSLPIGREGLNLAVRTAKKLTVVDAGKASTLTTSAATVSAALAAAGIKTDSDDRITGNLAAVPRNGQKVTIDRVLTIRKVVVDPIPFRTVRKADATLARGATKVVTAGSRGTARRTWTFTYLNGKPASQRMLGKVISDQPNAQVVAVGTKAAKVTASRSFARSGGGLNWAALAQCEAGGNPGAVSPSGYYGLYQFDVRTWHAVGGSGNPTNASAAEQTSRAQMLYNQRGASPWPVCGRNL